jgi:hypothetical protein
MSITVIESSPGDLDRYSYCCKDCGVEMRPTSDRIRDF